MADFYAGYIAVAAPGANAGAPGADVVGEVATQDFQDGGLFRVQGVVTSAGVPAYRRVLLIEQRSKRVIRETWSDPATGAYSFDYIKQGIYAVIGFDHTGAFDPEAKADLVAEAM